MKCKSTKFKEISRSTRFKVKARVMDFRRYSPVCYQKKGADAQTYFSE